jgi:hypothetical protein
MQCQLPESDGRRYGPDLNGIVPHLHFHVSQRHTFGAKKLPKVRYRPRNRNFRRSDLLKNVIAASASMRGSQWLFLNCAGDAEDSDLCQRCFAHCRGGFGKWLRKN